MSVFCKEKYANISCRKRNAQTVTIKTSIAIFINYIIYNYFTIIFLLIHS